MIDWDKHVLAPTMGVFGEPATYYPVVGGSFEVTGVFDRAYARSIPLEDGSFSATTTTPVLGVRLSQFVTAPVQGDEVHLPSVDTRFVIREVQEDGHGWAKLLLNKVAQ